MTEKQQEAVDALKRCGGINAAARELGISHTAVRKRLKGVSNLEGGSMKPDKVIPKNPVRSLYDFKQAYDKDTIIPAKIHEALQSIGNGWVYESEFVKIAGVTYADLGMYRDAYADHVVYIKRESKRAWAGTPELAQQMKEML